MCTFPSFWYATSADAAVGTRELMHTNSMDMVEQKRFPSPRERELMYNVNAMESEWTKEDAQYEYLCNSDSKQLNPNSLTQDYDQLFVSGDDIFNSHQVLNCKRDIEREGRIINKEDVDILTTKKLSHNANERQRRRKLNVLYSKLRSLLPATSPAITKKKLSIPAVVCRVLKYIPQLRKQIEDLSRQREELLAITRISEETSYAHAEPPKVIIQSDLKSQYPHRHEFPNVTIVAAESELLVTLYTDKTGLLFSSLLLLLEEESLDLLNASTFVSADKVWHTLQLKPTYIINSQGVAGNRSNSQGPVGDLLWRCNAGPKGPQGAGLEFVERKGRTAIGRRNDGQPWWIRGDENLRGRWIKERWFEEQHVQQEAESSENDERANLYYCKLAP
eukprot:Gb_33928 [translate_table: standard]